MPQTDARDPQYLFSQQYKDASNLNARVRLHELYSTNHYGWHRWVFDQFRFPSASRILELGCGGGYLFAGNQERVPAGWEVTLSDFSQGMVDEAQRALASSAHPFLFATIDAQCIPFPDASLDGVIANHMLYHVPNRPKALAEIRRVLKPGGLLYASTIGQAHMGEIDELTGRFKVLPHWKIDFNLENGAEQLTAFFTEVTLQRYEDALEIMAAEPLVAYVRSSKPLSLTEEQMAEFAAQAEREIAERGSIHVTKDSGMFEARKPQG